MAIMNYNDFVKIAKDIAINYKTLYILGCFGSPMTYSNKKRFTTNYSYNQEKNRKEKILAASSDTFGFDCVCLIKAILWGWTGDITKNYGGATYLENGVLDVGADEIMNYCKDVSSDFSTIQVGELLSMKGHVGIYIGDGLAVECTPIWNDGVQITAVSNIGKKEGYPSRTWTRHGKLKYIDYQDKEIITSSKKQLVEVAYEVIDGKWGNGNVRKEKLEGAGYNYKEVQSRVNEILSSQSQISYYPIPSYTGNSIVDALKEIQVDSDFHNRKNIAQKNGITNYTGRPTENIKLLSLLKSGRLLK